MRRRVLAVCALQVALPVSLLAVRWADQGSRPDRELPASWQMYSTAPPAAYEGRDAAGRLRPLDVAGLPPVLRAVDVGDSVPGRLCAAHPGLVAVTRTGLDPGTLRC